MSTFALQPTPTPSMYAHAIADAHKQAVQALVLRLNSYAIWLIKRTFQPSIIRKKRKAGFLNNAPSVDAVRLTDERPRRARGWVEESGK
jgi:ribosomal protein L34